MSYDEFHTIKEAKKGSSQAFEQIVKQFEKQVYNSALFIAKNRDDALDISQEVFIKLWKALPSFKGDSSLKTYIATITRNCALDYLKFKSKNDTDSLYFEDGNAIPIVDTNDLPQEEIIKNEQYKALYDGVNSLTPIYREIILLREFGNLSYEEIAKTLGISEGTVKSRISRAREELKNILKSRNIF